MDTQIWQMSLLQDMKAESSQLFLTSFSAQQKVKPLNNLKRMYPSSWKIKFYDNP